MVHGIRAMVLLLAVEQSLAVRQMDTLEAATRIAGGDGSNTSGSCSTWKSAKALDWNAFFTSYSFDELDHVMDVGAKAKAFGTQAVEDWNTKLFYTYGPPFTGKVAKMAASDYPQALMMQYVDGYIVNWFIKPSCTIKTENGCGTNGGGSNLPGSKSSCVCPSCKWQGKCDQQHQPFQAGDAVTAIGQTFYLVQLDRVPPVWRLARSKDEKSCFLHHVYLCDTTNAMLKYKAVGGDGDCSPPESVKVPPS